jgi:hypothetical protein
MNIMAVYFLNRRVHIPGTNTAIRYIAKIAKKAAFVATCGRYPQYDRTSGQVSTVQEARQARRCSKSPRRHRSCSIRPALLISMVTLVLDQVPKTSSSSIQTSVESKRTKEERKSDAGVAREGNIKEDRMDCGDYSDPVIMGQTLAEATTSSD